jgi:hypothetical protein
MKKTTKRLLGTIISALLCASITLQMPGVLAALTPEPKWEFMQLSVVNTGEVLSESNSYYDTDALHRAYNPNTERASLSFAVPDGQAYAIEVWTRGGTGDLYGGAAPIDVFVGYLRGNYGNDEYIFDEDTAFELVGCKSRAAPSIQ